MYQHGRSEARILLFQEMIFYSFRSFIINGKTFLDEFINFLLEQFPLKYIFDNVFGCFPIPENICG